jgi:hypothetical protein
VVTQIHRVIKQMNKINELLKYTLLHSIQVGLVVLLLKEKPKIFG